MSVSICRWVIQAALFGQVAMCAAWAQAPAPSAKPSPPLSRLAQGLFDKGHKACSKDLDTMVKWVHEDDTRYGLHSIWSADNSDKRTALGVTSESFGDGSMVSTFTSTLDATGKCSTVAVSVLQFPRSCTSVREGTFKSWKFVGEVGSTSLFEQSEEGVLAVYLTATPGGCQVVRRYIAYN